MAVTVTHAFSSAVANGTTAYVGTLASGSNQITAVTPTPPNYTVGYRLYHASIPSGTTITGVAGSTITMSANATGSATGTTFYTDDGQIQPSDWNAQHVVTGAATTGVAIAMAIVFGG